MNKGISIVVTAHAEGTLIHHTLMSILGAASQLDAVPIEIILHADNPTAQTVAYLDTVARHIPTEIDLTIFTNSFGNPGASRNFAVNHAKGQYVTFIDGDDIMSENWLKEAYSYLERAEEPTVAHSEYTIEFGDTNSIVKKYPSISPATDALLSVWAGRWNAIIFAKRSLILSLGYPSAKDGYGFEDWEMSCKLIAAGVHNITVPNTVMFVRRKGTDSVWKQHISEKAVLRANDCHSLSYVRALEEPKDIIERANAGLVLPASVDRYRHSKSLPIRVLRKVYRTLKATKHIDTPSTLPSPLIEHWKHAHLFDRQIYPFPELTTNPMIYHSLTDDHFKVGHAYKAIVDQTSYDTYDYLLFVPWLISGGADLYAINLANEIVQQKPDIKLAIVGTMPNVPDQVKPRTLDPKIDFISLSPATNNLNKEHVDRLIEQFIENSGAKTLHVINAIQAYDYINTHKKYLRGTARTVIATSFSQSVDPKTGRLYGYSHTHVPEVYDVCTLLTTDNEAVAAMWEQEYGFNRDKIQVIKPVVREPSNTPKTAHQSNEKKVLWAARLAPEKLVEIVPGIAKNLPSDITIDLYGTPGGDFDASILSNLPDNARYRGAFSDFYALPLEEYSAFLYTSLFDGMPNALVEATNAGLPIIASNAGGIGEFINDKTGRLVNDIYDEDQYAKMIKDILDNDALATSLVSEARKKLLSEYSPAMFSKSIAHYIKSIEL